MPFRFRDETAGRDLFYCDNAGQLGLGSLPNSDQALTVLGISVLDPSARFADGLFDLEHQQPIKALSVSHLEAAQL